MTGPANGFHYQAHPLRVLGSVIEARLADVRIGEICEILNRPDDSTVVARAQVMAFNGDITFLRVIGSLKGLSRQMVISPTGHTLTVPLSEDLRGTVVLPDGHVTERFDASTCHMPLTYAPVEITPPGYKARRGIDEMMITGVRSIDGLLPCGIGQRMGIFSAAGCGKTTLMQMLINNAHADIFVIALIGERGREVTEFIEELRSSPSRSKCIVVYASSDFSALDRVNAAYVAMTIAEYFRDLDNNVVLFLDSVTRYARALRDVALSAGQMPARRGYPASVFEQLPVLLERPGKMEKGSITAFFTVLMESEDETDPIAEEVRSIIDGHIYLSRKLAGRNHFPAIDVLSSISRVSTRVTDTAHQAAAAGARDTLMKLDELQTLITFGEYRPGENAENDRLYQLQPSVRAFLCQQYMEISSLDDTLQKMTQIVR